MVRVNIHNVASAGIIKDIPDHTLPPEAWTDGRNIRFINNKIVRFRGQQGVMDPPSVAPAFLMSLEGPGGVFWVYSAANGPGSKVYAFNSGTHADISQAGDYNFPLFRELQGTTFHGTPIINGNVGPPQYWPQLDLAEDLVDLPAWPADTTARIIRAYKAYLVAFHLTDGDGVHGHRTLWSDRAGPGELPGSWDHTDVTVDAGMDELSDVNSGTIQDAEVLRDMIAIYKNESTWLMRFKGGQDIMENANVLQTSGIMAPRCMTPLTLPIQQAQVHFVMNGLDLGVFNGQGFESVLYEKDKDFLVGDIDPINYMNSFVFDNPANDEAWFCYPQEGSSVPNTACIWNYRKNNVSFREFIGVHAAPGAVESASTQTWDTVVGSWDEQVGAWQGGARRKIVTADQVGTKLLQLDTGDTLNGLIFSSFIERTGLAIIGRDRMGQPKVDYEQRKIVRRVWPKVKGGRVRVTLGATEDLGEPPSYTRADGKNTAIYDPSGPVKYVDIINEGRLIAIKFEGVDGDYWEMDGYDIDVEPLGEH